MKKHGNVERMWIRGIKTPPGGMSKKVAFIKGLIPKEHPPLIVYVLYETVSDACQALNLNGEMFEAHRLRVTNSLKKTYDKNKGVFIGNLPLGLVA